MLMYCIGYVVHPVQNPHSVIIWDSSYSTLNILFSSRTTASIFLLT